MKKSQGCLCSSCALLLLSVFFPLPSLAASPVVAWGNNEYLQTNVPSWLTEATAIATGYNFDLALRPDGTVVGWGDPSFGQTSVPPSLTNATAIAAGYVHSLALTAEGRVLAWGANMYGQTNVPPGLSNVVAIAAGWYHNIALKSDGTVSVWGSDAQGQTNIPVGLTNVVAIAAGGNRSVALKANGSVITWGTGASSYPTNTGNIVAIACGDYHSLALTADGRVQAWGDNSRLQCSVPAGLSHVVAIAAGMYHSLALRADGTVVGWGANTYEASQAPAGLTNVVAIAAGYHHSVALVGNGPPFLTTTVIDRSVVWGRHAYFRAPATGLRPLTYQWQRNGTNVPGATNAVLALSNVQASATYALTVSNPEGSFTSPPAALNVVPLAITTQPVDRGAFELGSANFYVLVDTVVPVSYQWYHQGQPLTGNTNASGTTSSYLFLRHLQMSDAGTYSVMISNAVGTVMSRTATLTVTSSPPSITCQPYSILRDAGSAASFMVCVASVYPYSVQWYHDGTLLDATSSTLLLSNLSLADEGNYWCVVSNRGGMVTSEIATLTVVTRPPYIATQPVSQSVDAGGSVCFSVSVDGAPLPAIQWHKNGQPIPGANFMEYCLYDVDEADAGGYSVTVSNSLATLTSETGTLTVLYRPPVISGGPYDQTVWAGNYVTFSCSVAGGPTPRLQWLYNGSPIAEANSRFLSFPVNSTNQAGEYSLLASNSLGVVTSAVARLTVRIQPPYFTVEPVSLGVLEGNPVTLTGYAWAPSGVQYQWQFNGVDIQGATDPNFTIAQATAGSAGDYRVIASNEGGSITSRVATLFITTPGPLDRWEWRHPLPQGNDLLCAAYGNGIWVALGKNGTHLRSTDGGVSWQTGTSANERILAVAYGNGIFVAVGYRDTQNRPGLIQTSTDGIHWTDRTTYPLIGEEIQSIVFGNGRFVAASASGFAILSTNGLDWEELGIIGIRESRLAYGNNIFVALAPDSLATSPDGVFWTIHPDAFPGYPSQVLFANGVFVATTTYWDDYSRYYSGIWVSTDGSAWTETSQWSDRTWRGLAYGAGHFVAWGEPWYSEPFIRGVSTNGINWEFNTITESHRIMGAAGNSTTLLAVGDKGLIMTSTNGLDWVQRSPGESLNLRSVAYGNGLYLAVGNEGLQFTSTDGVNWVRQPPITEYNLRSVAYGNGHFVAVGEIATNYAVILRSSDGLQWTGSEATVFYGLYSVAFGKGMFVAVGYNNAIYTSTDGYSWTWRSSGYAGRFNAVTFNGETFAAVGTGGIVATSTDGLAWPYHQTSTYRFLQGVAYGNGRFVAAGQSGALTVSTNGTDWYGPASDQYPFQGTDIEDVQFANGHFIAVGEDGYIATSLDGLIWTARNSQCQNTLRCSVYVKGRVIAVGNNATILRSDFFGPPALHVWRSASPGELTLAVDAEVGGTYRLQASENFVDWDDIFTFRNTQVRTMFQDSGLDFTRKQFYRVVTP